MFFEQCNVDLFLGAIIIVTVSNLAFKHNFFLTPLDWSQNGCDFVNN